METPGVETGTIEVAGGASSGRQRGSMVVGCQRYAVVPVGTIVQTSLRVIRGNLTITYQCVIWITVTL